MAERVDQILSEYRDRVKVAGDESALRELAVALEASEQRERKVGTASQLQVALGLLRCNRCGYLLRIHTNSAACPPCAPLRQLLIDLEARSAERSSAGK